MSRQFRVLICGGREYGEIWDENLRRTVPDAVECARFTRIMGNLCRGVIEGRSFSDRGAPPYDPPIWAEAKPLDGRDTSALLNEIREAGTVLRIIHGDAKGADRLAKRWAEYYGVDQEPFPADWRKHGYAAGPIRNRQMLDEGVPNLVIGFPGGAGTKDMTDTSIKRGIPTWKVRA